MTYADATADLNSLIHAMDLHLSAWPPYTPRGTSRPRGDGVPQPGTLAVQVGELALYTARMSHLLDTLHQHAPEDPTPEALHQMQAVGAALVDLSSASADLSGALKLSQRLERHSWDIGPHEQVEARQSLAHHLDLCAEQLVASVASLTAARDGHRPHPDNAAGAAPRRPRAPHAAPASPPLPLPPTRSGRGR